MAGNIRVRKDEENPESPEILAASLIKIAEGFEKLIAGNGGLTQDAVVALLIDMPKIRGHVGKREINLILNNLVRLKSYYVRKPVR